MSNEIDLFTASEVAKLLRVSRGTVSRLTRSGKLPHFRVGRIVRYPEAEIMSLMMAPVGYQAASEQGGAD